jgi:hypothetical protein
MTRLSDAAIHNGDMFIKPAELAGVRERHGLQPAEMAQSPGHAPGPATARHVQHSPVPAAPARCPAGGRPAPGR